jgi:transcriptional regulator
MYIPGSNRQDDPDLLSAFMRANSFATLITQDGDSPFASHLPFVLDTERGAHGTLRAHLARANPQWRQFDDTHEALVVFQGPHAYISPTWYAIHPSVPTWNYAVVHAYGAPKVLDDAGLYAVLRDSVVQYESSRQNPWEFGSLTEEYLGKMMQAIVGFELEITRLEGKYKMSQGRPEADIEGAIAGLTEGGDPLELEVARMMESIFKESVKK